MSGPEVLIVDDDEATREGLCQLLALDGFDVGSEKDGAKALERILAGDIQVVLLDVLLPGVGGLDVLARCAQDGSSTRIIIMCSKSSGSCRTWSRRPPNSFA